MTQDPSDRSAARADAEQVASLSRLAGGLAHEIKNPLSTMAINLTLLQEDWEKAASVRNAEHPEATPREQRSLKRIRGLQREVQRLEDILAQFLQFARGAEINRKPEDLARIVREILEFVEPENQRAGIRQHVDLQIGLPLVLVDETQIKQALVNLLVNARQAMPTGGELLVRLYRQGSEGVLAITDTGVGMRPEQIERCFEVYWSDKRGGTGLGLSTAKRIVEEHGGHIEVLSEAGRGTSFSIFLPLAVELAGQSAERAAEQEAEHAAQHGAAGFVERETGPAAVRGAERAAEQPHG
jgi:signal transduction histidine kinase